VRFVADLHVHSKYSRATSPEMDVQHLASSARRKGIAVLGTGDFTHPAWFSELRSHLAPAAPGLFRHEETYFVLTAEVNNTYVQAGRGHRIHNLLLVPSFEIAARVNQRLSHYGDLTSDARPTLSLSSRDLLELVTEISPDCVLVPGHIWTPHFSLFGANSGYDRIEECFGDLTTEIFCLETGLSSDPAMNWRLSALDRFALVSNSDSHSPARIGREANIFDCELSYPGMVDALKRKDSRRFLGTLEFFPEEGKYHYDGHRPCAARVSPEESRLNNGRCPKCGKRLTIGVLHRVENLADRPVGFIPPGSIPFRNCIPLEEIIAAALGVGVGTVAVEREYRRVVNELESEFNVLLEASPEDLRRVAVPAVAEGILRVRERRVTVLPGYDGVYGEVRFLGEDEPPADTQGTDGQMTLF
jgi:uncharacterized protein (TIGR00375 family)